MPFSITHLVDSYNLIRVSGVDAAKFLQGQLTCDIQKITPTQPAFSAYCNHQGRVLAFLRVFLEAGNYYLALPQTMIAVTLAQLKKYGAFSKIEFSVEHITMQNAISENDWKLSNISAGIPEIYPETSLLFTPHMLNLPALHAVSFTKGCYLGQEIIARTEHLGKSKRHLYHAQATTAVVPAPGTVIHDEQLQAVGYIIDAARSENENCELLVVLQENALTNSLLYSVNNEPIVALRNVSASKKS